MSVLTNATTLILIFTAALPATTTIELQHYKSMLTTQQALEHEHYVAAIRKKLSSTSPTATPDTTPAISTSPPNTLTERGPLLRNNTAYLFFALKLHFLITGSMLDTYGFLKMGLVGVFIYAVYQGVQGKKRVRAALRKGGGMPVMRFDGRRV